MDPERNTMFTKILIAKRGDNGRKAVAAKPNRMLREAHAGEFPAETHHV
jgi:hypothetical protein